MLSTITEISVYLLIAIALGYLFGWLITKAMQTPQRDKSLKSIKDIENLTRSNKELLTKNNQILLENSEFKLKIVKLIESIEEKELLLKKLLKKFKEKETFYNERLEQEKLKKEKELILLKYKELISKINTKKINID